MKSKIKNINKKKSLIYISARPTFSIQNDDQPVVQIIPTKRHHYLNDKLVSNKCHNIYFFLTTRAINFQSKY